MASDSEPRRQSRLVELLSSERHSPVVVALSSYLGLAGFQLLFQASRELYQLKDYFRKQHDINSRLRHFVADPDLFRCQLVKNDALISGGFALSFLELSRLQVSNLDIVVRLGNSAGEFESYVRDQEGYETVANDNTEAETVRYSSRFRYSKR